MTWKNIIITAVQYLLYLSRCSKWDTWFTNLSSVMNNSNHKLSRNRLLRQTNTVSTYFVSKTGKTCNVFLLLPVRQISGQCAVVAISHSVFSLLSWEEFNIRRLCFFTFFLIILFVAHPWFPASQYESWERGQRTSVWQAQRVGRQNALGGPYNEKKVIFRVNAILELVWWFKQY